MKCPHCYASLKQIPGNNKLEVDCITRTKMCLNCGYTFETVEIDKDMYDRIIRIVGKDTRNPQPTIH